MIVADIPVDSSSGLGIVDIAGIIGGVAAAIFVYDVVRSWAKRSVGREMTF